jgi:hypothetical protein
VTDLELAQQALARTLDELLTIHAFPGRHAPELMVALAKLGFVIIPIPTIPEKVDWYEMTARLMPNAYAAEESEAEQTESDSFLIDTGAQ